MYHLRLDRKSLSSVSSFVLFGVWFAIVLWLTVHHAYWRDEVRALNIATQGDSIGEMLVRLRGEGHPALWYVLLRLAYGLLGPVALPMCSLIVAAAAAALLIWRSPFGFVLKALLLASKFFLFEYVVMARNYGIGMLLIFSFAALYPK